MKHIGLALFTVSICIVGGCSVSPSPGDPLDDVSSVPDADRAALHVCLTAADLPGNHWPARAGKARCWLSLPQNPSLKEIAAMLKEPDGALKLDRRYADILTAHYNDPAHRDFLFVAFQDFGTPEGQRLAADWLANSRGSAFAHMAMGEAALGAAWNARGHEFAAKTADNQFQGMAEQLRIATPLLQTALLYEPRLSPACVDLMEIGNMVGDAKLRDTATQHCARVDPLSWHLNSMWLTTLDPRWGGSFDALDRAVEQIRQREAKNPMLASLLAKGMGRRAYMPINDDTNLLSIAAKLYQTALTAPDPFYLDKAGLAAEHAGNTSKALVYVSQALRFAPNDADFLSDRAALFVKAGQLERSLADARRAAAQPDDCGCNDHTSLAMVFLDLNRIDDERMELQKAMQKKDDRLWALKTLCKTYLTRNVDSGHGLPCTKQLAEEFPEDSESLYLRALMLYIVHDPAAADFDTRFRKLADPSEPSDQAEIAQLDRLQKAQASQR